MGLGCSAKQQQQKQKVFSSWKYHDIKNSYSNTSSVWKSYQSVTKLAVLWWVRNILQTNLQGQFSRHCFCPPFVTLNFFSMCLSHKQGMRHMDLITKAVIHVYFHLIRNSSGRPKNSFWLYHFKRVDTHVF